MDASGFWEPYIEDAEEEESIFGSDIEDDAAVPETSELDDATARPKKKQRLINTSSEEEDAEQEFMFEVNTGINALLNLGFVVCLFYLVFFLLM